MAQSVVGLYYTIDDARMAVQELEDLGIPRTDISVMTRAEGEDAGHVEAPAQDAKDEAKTPTDVHTDAMTGAGVGAAVGGLGALLVGIGIMAVPGMRGSVLVAGRMLALLTGAGFGAGLGAFLGALVGMGVPKEEAEYYAEGVRRGEVLVAVSTPEERVDEVRTVLRRHHPVDVRRQAATWRAHGWKGYDPNAEPLTHEELERERSTFAPVEGATDVAATPAAAATDLPTGRNSLYTGETYPKEGAARAREAMEHTHPATNEDVRPWEDYEADFRADWERRRQGDPASWAHYKRVYRYGYDMAHNPRYSDRDWDDVEGELRQGWEDYQLSAWEEIKESVRTAWDRVRGER